MIIHDKLGKQAGEVVVFGLASSCDVTVRQALNMSQLKTLSTHVDFPL